ncbi:GNAT family N-acetyltransferase [Nocardia transvalensis]|uniref:GNAT family N-acetyltransferase n=1 Tax=Nocardia transvalensis TaxID=37333 RepID=UPI002B4B0D0D|nr:GNAT family N-acetyltransferase [Nocardia transvalensis]
MTGQTVSVRLATVQDVPRALETLGQAFRDYPYMRHILAADDHQRRVTQMQALMLERIGLPHGRVWVADDCAAVAVWTTPDSTGVLDAFAEIESRMVELAGDRVEAMREAEQALSPHRPTEPTWFLGVVGVDPQLQGRGLGKAVIRPGLAEADRAGLPAYLETSDERNVHIYRSLGFEVTAEVELTRGGPRTWSMVREPATA